MLLITKGDCGSGARPPDPPLLKALARGHTWFAALVSGRVESVRELAKREGVTDRYISRQVALAFMAPKFVEAVVAGEQRFSSFCIEDLREGQLHSLGIPSLTSPLVKRMGTRGITAETKAWILRQQIPYLRVAGSNPAGVTSLSGPFHH
jgi:hypothetical protein